MDYAMQACDRCDIDDAATATIEHLLPEGLTQQKGRSQIDRDHLLPLINARFFSWADQANAGIVHQSIRAAIVPLHLRGEFRYKAGIGYVARNCR